MLNLCWLFLWFTRRWGFHFDIDLIWFFIFMLMFLFRNLLLFFHFLLLHILRRTGMRGRVWRFRFLRFDWLSYEFFIIHWLIGIITTFWIFWIWWWSNRIDFIRLTLIVYCTRLSFLLFDWWFSFLFIFSFILIAHHWFLFRLLNFVIFDSSTLPALIICCWTWLALIFSWV